MDARGLITLADRLARDRGFNQSEWSSIAGYAVNGQTVSRIMAKGDCRVSTFLALLHAIGYELHIEEEANG